MTQTKRYKLNKDFSIDCETRVLFKEVKQYSVRVIFTGSTFEEVVGSLSTPDKDEANNYFKIVREKYREGTGSVRRF